MSNTVALNYEPSVAVHESHGPCKPSDLACIPLRILMAPARINLVHEKRQSDTWGWGGLVMMFLGGKSGRNINRNIET